MLTDSPELAVKKNRVWEIDFLRGLAVCMMLVSNFMFDLFFFYSLGDPESGFLAYFSRAVAGLFLFVVGVSLTLSVQNKNKSTVKRLFSRSVRLFALALIISLVTYYFVGNGFIIFGILHLISVSILFGYLFLGYTWINLIVGLIVILLGQYVEALHIDSYWLIWLGVRLPGFSSVDYTPLIPWFGPVLIGICFGNVFYKKRETLFKQRQVQRHFFVAGLRFLGKRSLLIYCLHQPLFWTGIFLYNKILF